MATNVQRGGLGFEKLFRRMSRSPSPAKGAEENPDKKLDRDTTSLVNCGTSKSGKSLGQKPTDRKNESFDGRTLANEINDDASQKTNFTKKSTKKKNEDETKANEKMEDLETCKELIIKDDAGQVKLTEIINNSIKEAVLNIVKEGVCPLADSLDTRGKEPMKKLAPAAVEETQDKENKPGNSKRLSSLLSAEKTFDSHLCRSQFQPSTQYQPSISPRSPQRVSEHEKPTIPQCNHDLCPRVVKERKPKCIKPKEKKPREICQKIPRQVKGSSHFKTDNRRMTGNVNIYICSEANENAKDQNKKPKADEETCLEESESASETKTCTSSLSVSTSKLIAALRKKRTNNMDDSSLTCLCDITESCPKQQRSIDKIEDVCCICDENGEPGSTDTLSSSSRDDYLCGDAKFSDLDFPGSGTDCDSVVGNLNNYSPCTTEDCPIRQDSCQRGKTEGQGKNQERDVEERCSCCDLKRCQREWKSQQEKTCRRESRERTSWMQREDNGQETNKCPCIVEEEDEDCCAERKKSEEFTICVNQPIDEIPGDASRINDLDKNPSPSSSSALKETRNGSPKSVPTLQIASTQGIETADNQNSSKVSNDSKTVKPETPKKLSKQVEKVADPSDSSKNNSSSPTVTEGKRRSSFFYRSMKKAMSMVKTKKEEEPTSTEEAEKPVEPTPPAQEKLETNTVCGDEKEEEPCVPSCCERVKEKPTTTCPIPLNPEKRSMSRISTAIASRRSSGGPGSDSSKVNIPICSSLINKKEEPKDQCKCKKPPESCECSCRKPELVKNEGCKCCPIQCPKVTNEPNPCFTKLETPKCCCPTCRNPANRCLCRTTKYQPMEPKPPDCCPKCKRPVEQCKCCCSKQDKPEEESCNCCCRPKSLCCCNPVRIDTAQSKKCRPSWENCQRCTTCCRPRNECRCQRRCCEDRGMKSMICMYCDNPQDMCICRAPVRKCSQCCLPLDVCNCKPAPCCECNGRDILITDDCNERMMCVTAWKPRRNVGRYFARSVEDQTGNSDEDCVCWEKSKPYGSDRLAYQKRGAFSDVMNELQQKISGSVCCSVCGKEACCCCCVQRQSEEKIKIRPCTSKMGERKSPGRSQKRSRSRSPTDSCKYNPRRKNGRQPTKSCDRCETSPCRCGKSSKSSRKKPQAKCYYCKRLPCVCSVLDNPRSLRNADSSNRRRKEYRDTLEEKIIDNDNRYRARDTKCFVSCPGNQQPLKKHCYRVNSNGHPLHPSQRVV